MQSNAATKNTVPAAQVLCGWGEVPDHPGLVTAVLQSTGNPVIVMVEPEKIISQEIKVGTKSKIMDMVTIRHSSFNSVEEEKTTMILLCEDGSLKIYMSGQEAAGYWLQPRLQPVCALSVPKHKKKKPSAKHQKSSGSLNFPLDFFEHCNNQTTDIEFGGQDILQVKVHDLYAC